MHKANRDGTTVMNVLRQVVFTGYHSELLRLPVRAGEKFNQRMENLMTEHTPTPWRIDVGTFIVDEDDETITECDVVNFDGEANARFIVTACNRDHLFEEMRKMLSGYQSFLRDSEHPMKDTIMDKVYDLLTRIDAEEEAQ